VSAGHAWRALRSANFRLFFAGQGISVMGTWMTRLAATWLVYRLTHSVWMLGVIGFAGQIVSFAIGPFAGVWVERMERRRMLVVTQAAACLHALTLAVLTLTGAVRLWHVLALTVLQGIINAFDMPGRQSFLVQLVEDRDDLSNAIALNSLMNNGARLVGPALAGLVVAAVGEGWCFLADGVSYLAVIASLLVIRTRPVAPRASEATLWQEMREGWEYVSGVAPIRTVLVLFALLSLMGTPFSVVLPAIATGVLHGGPQTLGWLGAAAGVGTMAATALLAARHSVVGLERSLVSASLSLGGGLALLGMSRWLVVSLAMMVVVGFGLMQTAAVCNTVLQALVTEDKRARVMSYYTMAFFGGAPIGSLLLGAAAERLGAAPAIVVSGICCTAGAVWMGAHLRGLRAALHAAAARPEMPASVPADEVA
jgi:MFS family permease